MIYLLVNIIPNMPIVATSTRPLPTFVIKKNRSRYL